MLGVAATLMALPAGPAPSGSRARGLGPASWTRRTIWGPAGRYRRGYWWRCAHPGGTALLLGWAARHGLRATWFRGQPTALLAARPAVLGRALGVRVDDFRLPGYPRLLRVPGHRGAFPAPLNAEVATVSRITSFGPVQSVEIPPVPPRAAWPREAS